ncbi:hypothetical protein BH20ACT10_BH20ACT10_22640 [soil metagenome]|jgi:hypothetical protein
MKHRVAVWADWAHILDRIYLIAFTNISERLEMMNVNKSLADLTVHILKVKTAYAA